MSDLLSVAEAIRAGAPKNLVILARVIVSRGWDVSVSGDGDLWRLDMSSEGDARTERYMWRGGKWSPANTFGFRQTLAYFRDDYAGAPAAEAPSEAPSEAPEVPADAEGSAVTAGGVILDAGKEAQALLVRVRDLALSAKGLRKAAESACEDSVLTVTAREAELYAAECAEAFGQLGLVSQTDRDHGGKRPATGMVKEARSALREIKKLRKVIADTSQAVAGDAGMAGVFDHWHSATVDAESDAREALETIEECSESAESDTDACASQTTCPRCECFLLGEPGKWSCGCRLVLAAGMEALGSGCQDAQAARAGRWLESDDETLREAGELAAAGRWFDAEAKAAEAGAQGQAEALFDGGAQDDAAPVAVPVLRVLPGAVEAAAAEREHAARMAKSQAQHEAMVQARRDAVEGPALRTWRRDGKPVDVRWVGVSEQCASHCPDECPGWDHAEDCTCEARPVVIVDGPGEPYTWEDCAECAAGTLGVPFAVIAECADPVQTVTDKVRKARGTVLADELHEESVACEARFSSAVLQADTLVEEWEGRDVSEWVTETVALWRQEAAQAKERAQALAAVASQVRGQGWPLEAGEGPAEPAPAPTPEAAPAAPAGAAGRVVPLADVAVRERARAQAARPAAERAAFVARERFAWLTDARDLRREALAAHVDGRSFCVDEPTAREWLERALLVSQDAADTADGAASVLDTHEWAAEAAERHKVEQADAVAQARASAERMTAPGYAPEGYQVWRSADGRSVIVAKPHPDDHPDREAAERTGAYLGALAGVVAAKDEGRKITSRDYGKQDTRGKYRGPGAGMKAAVVASGQPLVKVWAAPRIPAAGRALDGAALAALDAEGVCAEIEESPGVWLPRAAVMVAEHAQANGWAVAMERRGERDGLVVAVRFAGTVQRPGAEPGVRVPVTGQCVATWVGGMYDASRSGAWVDGSRAPGRSGLTAVLSTVGQAAEAAPIVTGLDPAPAAGAADVVSDPGSVDGWESEGGFSPDVYGDRVAYTGPVVELPGHIELSPPAECDNDLDRPHGTPGEDSDPGEDSEAAPYACGFRPAVLDGYARATERDGYEWHGWTCETHCATCQGGTACEHCEACTSFAAPYPPHWAHAPRDGEPYRGVEIFGGPGGMSAARALVDRGGDWVLIEFNRDAADTARAAGHYVICADVRTLDPRHPVLRHVSRFHGSPPCQTLTTAGKRAAWNDEEIGELQSLLYQASEAFGFLEADDLCSLDGGPHDYSGMDSDFYEGDHDAWNEDLCWGGYLPPTLTPDEYRQSAKDLVSDERTALMAEMLIWPMCMVQNGAPLESVTLEQSPNLIRQTPRLAQAIQSEFLEIEGMGWSWCSWQIADAADTGAATHRERAWMIATRGKAPRYAARCPEEQTPHLWSHLVKRLGRPMHDYEVPEMADWVEPYQGRNRLPVVTLAAALNLPEDWYADTRGKRGINPKTGKQLGGGSFPVNTVGQCVTAPWYGIKFRPADVPQGEGTVKISREQLGTLVGFLADYPWRYTPTRAGAQGTRNVAQMIADAVSPFMLWISSAVNEDADDWYETAIAYQAAVYRLKTPASLASEGSPAPSRLAIEGAPARLALETSPGMTGRPYWEPAQRVTLAGRPGRTMHSSITHGVRVCWDDRPDLPTWEEPQALWAEGHEPAPARVLTPPYRPAPRVITLPAPAPVPVPQPVPVSAPEPQPVPTAAPVPQPVPVPVLDRERAHAALDLIHRIQAIPAPVPAAAPMPQTDDERAQAALAFIQSIQATQPQAQHAPQPTAGQDDHDRPTLTARARTLAGWYAPALLALLVLAVLGAPVAGGITAAVLALLPRLPAWVDARNTPRPDNPTHPGNRGDHDLAA